METVMTAATLEQGAQLEFQILSATETLEDLFWREDWTGLARLAHLLEYKSGRKWTVEEYVRDLVDDLDYIRKYMRYGGLDAVKSRIWDAVISDERRLIVLWVGILGMLTSVSQENGMTMFDLPTEAQLATLTAIGSNTHEGYGDPAFG